MFLRTLEMKTAHLWHYREMKLAVGEWLGKRDIRKKKEVI